MKAMSISIAKGKGSIRHNNREFITENVNKDKISDNIIYKQEPLSAAYEKCFGKAIEEYNFKQKRSDRKIDGVQGYMEQVRTSGNGEKLFYENVIQVGNMQDCGIGSENGEIAKRILDEYMKNFQDRNPNLYVFNAVLHLDEQTPHLHVDYIPLASDYKNGLQVRNSLDRALKQQGIDGKSNKYENRTISWQNSEKNHIEKIMNSRGLERAEDKGLKATHKSVEYYKAVVNDIKNEIKELPSQIQSKPTILDKDKVTVKKEDLELLEQRAKLSSIHEDTAKKIIEDISKTQENGNKYVVVKMSRALNELDMAEKERDKVDEELKQAKQIKEKYSKLYKQQEDLNEKYKKLHGIYQNQKAKISELEADNTSLKAEIDTLSNSFDEKVQMIVEPLKEQIESLKSHLKGSMQSFTNVIKAVGMLKYENGQGYKAEFTEKQIKLIDAVTKYAKSWIDRDGEGLNDDTAKNCKEDIEKHIGISKGIQSFIEPDYPERLIFKGGEQGRGFYDKDKNFYGSKDILKELKERGVKISDPYELLPGERSL